VIDAVGREVGLVTRRPGYYGSAQIVTELTLPGRSAPQFVVGEVDGTGLQKDFSCSDTRDFYKTPTCTGQAYAIVADGECELTPGEFFAQPILYQSTATGASSAIHPRPSWPTSSSDPVRLHVAGASRAGLPIQRRHAGVVPVAAAARGLFCADCCSPRRRPARDPGAHVRREPLGTPQFRLTQ
jgi:hypothetical protein